MTEQKLIEYINDEVIKYIPKVILSIIVFAITLYLSKLATRSVKYWLNKKSASEEISKVISRFIKWTVIFFGTLWSLDIVDFNIIHFVAGLGIVGFSLGFALQGLTQNFVAGILMILYRPFKIGDFIEVGDFSGVVIDIETQLTKIRTPDGLLVNLPNSFIYNRPVLNYSQMNKRRISIKVGVSYNEDLEKVETVLNKAISEIPGVIIDNPAPLVVFKEFADSTINLEFYFWHEIGASHFGTLSTGIKVIKKSFDENGIDIPYPIQVNHSSSENAE